MTDAASAADYAREAQAARLDRLHGAEMEAAMDAEAAMEAAPPAHLKPRRSDRGLAYLPLIHGVVGYGGSVQVYESSGAEYPRIWLDADCGDGEKGVVHLELADAVKLAEQLMWLAENHYQIREGS